MYRMVLAAVHLMVPGTARAQTDGAPDTERYTLRAEVGLEYDTNAHRTEIVAGANNPPIVASALERLVLAGTLSDLVADGQILTLAATAAGKIYDARAATGEDVAIAQSSLAWAKALSPRATFTLSGAYYEAFQAPVGNLIDAIEQRDFRSLAPTAQLGWIPAPRVRPVPCRAAIAGSSSSPIGTTTSTLRPLPSSCAGRARRTTTPTGRSAPAPLTSTGDSAGPHW